MSSVAPKGALGDPPRFAVRAETRTVYVIEWERDWLRPYGIDGEDTEARVASRKVYLSKRGAYEALARKMIFAKRDGFDTPSSCSLCAQEPQYQPDDPRFCRYHDDETFQRLTRRLARWLMWRDRRRADGR